MEIIVKGLIIAIFIAICCYFIIKNINTALLENNKELKKTNKYLLSLYQNEADKSSTLYRIIFQVKNELSLLKRKDCPEEEFKNIPFEIIEWIDMLEKVSNGEENGIHK